MPFKSKTQVRWMFANHPRMAHRWASHTQSIKSLPEQAGKGHSKAASLLGLLDMGGFIQKLALAAAALAKPLGAVAGNDTLTSTQTLTRGQAPNAASGISPGALPSLGTPGSQGIDQQPSQAPGLMPHAAPPANPSAGPTTGQVAAPPPAQAAQAPAPAQAPGAFKPSAVFSVPHPPSVTANHHAHITSQFTPPAAPQQPKMAGVLRDLAIGRLIKAAQPPYPNALPQGGSFQGGWYVPPSFQPGAAWPSGYRAPGYAGPGTPGLPGFPAGMAGGNLAMPQGYGNTQAQPNPFQALDDKARQVEDAFVGGKMNRDSYQRWQTYLQKQRALTQQRLDLVNKNRPPVAAAPDFQPPGADKPGPQDTYTAMQDQRAQREAEYAKRQAMQKEIDGYHEQAGVADREAYNKRFGTQTIAEFEAMAARDPAVAKMLERYKYNHLTAVMGQNYANATPEQREEAWARDKQKLTVGQMLDTQAADYNARDGSVQKFYESQYQDPAFKDLANNPAFQELQRKAQAGDAGAKAELDKIRMNHRNSMDPSRLMDNPQMQLLQRTDPAKFNALMQHAQTWGQYKQDYDRDTTEWDKTKGDYLAGPGAGGAAKPSSGHQPFHDMYGKPIADVIPVPGQEGSRNTVVGGAKGAPWSQGPDGMPKGAPTARMPPPAQSKPGPAGVPAPGVASLPAPQPQAAVTQPVQPPAPAAPKPAPPGLLGSAPGLSGPKPGAPAGPGPIGSIKPSVKPPTIKPPSSPGLAMGGAKPSAPSA